MKVSHRPTDAPSALALIADADYPSADFEQDWPVLHAAIGPHPPAERLAWARAMDRLAGRIANRPDSLAFQRGLACLAASVGYPGLALDSLHRLDVHGNLGDQDILLMARCCLTTGDAGRATRLASLLRRRGLQTAELHQLQERIDLRLTDHQPPWRLPLACGPELLLEPLCIDHAPDIARQYREPSTAVLTGLPAIDPDLPAEQWVQWRLDDSPATYAWVHRRWGLVGYGDLYLHRQAGYLCMWVGADFRGQGLGRALVSALCGLAFERGLDLVLSSAYETNQRSIRSLQASRFSPIPIQAVEPDHERRFFYLSSHPVSPTRARRRLIEFCDLTGTGVRFRPAGAAPLPATATPNPDDKELSWPST